MNCKIIVFLLFCCWQTFAQEKNAERETKTIYILGGIVSSITKEDIAFSKKYNIQYYDFGCVAPLDFDKYEKANAQVFENLTASFGKQWEKEIKNSAMGFLEWKKVKK
ncbi:hypothetical protein [Flavobacterium sp. J27]|uniref:FEKKY domain-containing protein n=1 Tax=Flavobacterium sp. J27 TaxID=2060419 RepID=UPI00102FF3F4|nr:hypothetical protein [Flavobacterium sp. J27]